VIEAHTRAIAEALDVVGPINVQFAVKHVGDPAYGGDQVFVIEANPRASRTVPFVSKATGVPLAKVAARVMAGSSLAGLREEGLARPPVRGGHVSVKEAVLPFSRFPDADTLLGPEMRSTGEVMGIDSTFGLAFAKSQAAAGDEIPFAGTVFFSLADRDKQAGLAVARRFVQLGFSLAATEGTAAFFEADGVPVATVVAKVGAGAESAGAPSTGAQSSGPASPAGVGAVVSIGAGAGEPSPPERPIAGVDAVTLIAEGKVDIVVNTPRGRGPRADGAYIRRAANQHRVVCLTTVAAARAAVAGIADRSRSPLTVRSLQEYHEAEQLPLT
jgi:carbamoyl-phosphate synthase large subunit